MRGGAGPGAGPRSRGLIVNDFLSGSSEAPAYTRALSTHAADYAGFNLLAYDGSALCWYSNCAAGPRQLERGIYTLSNAQLDTAWPKSERLRAAFGRVVGVSNAADTFVSHLLDILRDDQTAADHELPQTGIGHAMERVLSSIFIRGDSYGTRCSSVVLIDDQGSVTFHERRYDRAARVNGETRIEFELAAPPA